MDVVYRFLDKLNSQLKPEIEQIAFSHTKSKLLKMDDEQAELYHIIQKNFQGVPILKTGGLRLHTVGAMDRFLQSLGFLSRKEVVHVEP